MQLYNIFVITLFSKIRETTSNDLFNNDKIKYYLPIVMFPKR